METYRLKNIAILILLLLNLCLALLLGYQYLQFRWNQRETVKQLESLCLGSQLSLGEDVEPLQEALPPVSLVRREETEAAIAATVLGEPAAVSSQGGGICTYTAAAGSLQFRAGGSFDGSQLSLPVADMDAFVEGFCQDFGYGNVSSQVSGGTGDITLTQYVSDVPVLDCVLTLHFDRGVLTGVTGAYASLENALMEPDEPLTCATALLRFLDYRNSAGVICSEVRSIRCVYQLQNVSSTLRLLPVWLVETDTYSFLVDCGTGLVSRR